MTDQYEEHLRTYFSSDSVIQEFAKNFGRLPRHPFLKTIHPEVRACMIEANMCFVISAYNATVVLSWMALECHLRLHLPPNDAEPGGQSLVDLLNRSGERGLLTQDQVQALHELRKIRNIVIHSTYLEMPHFGASNEHAVRSTKKINASALNLYTLVDAILHTYYSNHQA